MNNDIGEIFSLALSKITNMRSSSLSAYDELSKSKKLGAQEARILTSLKLGWDYSLQEISHLTKIPINAVSGRVNGLKKKGFLVETEKRLCSITGKKIIPVMIPLK